MQIETTKTSSDFGEANHEFQGADQLNHYESISLQKICSEVIASTTENLVGVQSLSGQNSYTD